MRTKLILIATVVAALAIGVTASNAALQNSVSVTLKFKKAKGPGTLKLSLLNTEDGGLVPQRIKEMIIASKSGVYNTKALPYCKIVPTQTVGGKDEIPTNAAGNNKSDFLAPQPGAKNPATVLKNCPLKSIVGKGTFEAVVGTPGQPYDPSQAGLITGNVYLFNYKPRSGDTLAFVAWIQSDNPVQNANQYQYVGVSKKGVIRTILPNRQDIPPFIADLLPPGIIAMTKLNLTLTSPKPPSGKKPIFSVKSFTNLDITGQLIRE
ncbi:MAG: hypothetical protein HYX29_08325 [Solirubrobacterales bacterium]|nr:hypothetical protein [Solirubrobacterales bacterium]